MSDPAKKTDAQLEDLARKEATKTLGCDPGPLPSRLSHGIDLMALFRAMYEAGWEDANNSSMHLGAN